MYLVCSIRYARGRRQCRGSISVSVWNCHMELNHNNDQDKRLQISTIYLGSLIEKIFSVEKTLEATSPKVHL